MLFRSGGIDEQEREENRKKTKARGMPKRRKTVQRDIVGGHVPKVLVDRRKKLNKGALSWREGKKVNGKKEQDNRRKGG